MFEKFLNEYAKNVRHINEKMSPVEQLSVLLREGIDYMWLSGEKVRVNKTDAKLILSYYNEADRNQQRLIAEEIATEIGLRKLVAGLRREVREAEAKHEKLLAENVSAMFDLVRNLKYVPGLEKVVTVNNTIDGIEATVQAVDGARYHVRVTPVSEVVSEDFHDRRWYKEYKAWDSARRSVPTDDDDRFVSRYEGKVVARWNEDDDEGWIRADKMVEGWGDPPRRQRRLKTGSINTPLIGRRIVMRRTGEEGTVTRVEREPTFSQMVPYILIYDVELDNGEHIEARREEFKVLKDQPVAEDLSLARGGDGEKKTAIAAMRKAAVTMVGMGVGRNEERARLHLQTIGLNYGLKPDDAAEIAQKILAKEMGLRRSFLSK